eukprot:3572467-Amphidinium_carterae.1
MARRLYVISSELLCVFITISLQAHALFEMICPSPWVRFEVFKSQVVSSRISYPSTSSIEQDFKRHS